MGTAQTKTSKRRKNFVEEWRVAFGYTQTELGIRVGYAGHSQIQRIETGKDDFTGDTLDAMSEVFGCHWHLLLLRAPTDEEIAHARELGLAKTPKPPKSPRSGRLRTSARARVA